MNDLRSKNNFYIIKYGKHISFLLLMSFIATTILITTACKDSAPSEIDDMNQSSVQDAFNNGTSQRDMIVIISDLHLGADLTYAEIKDNIKPLENLLNKIRVSANVKELVIAGDMLDEWFVPAYIDTYNGKDQRDFVQRIAETNKGIISAFNNIIKEKKILVTYVPGNHDLTITAENVELILPGIKQARDRVLGLGTYSPEGQPQIAIEHGHRYNFFCAPDPYSNQDVAPGTIMPPGYFFTRIAALHVDQKLPTGKGVVTPITPNVSGNESQSNLYRYWKIWEWAGTYLTIKNNFSEKIIVTNIDGFTKNYSVNDFLPYQKTSGGEIDVNLYKGIQDTWDLRQIYNLVNVKIETKDAILYSNDDTGTDNMAKTQYFLNPQSNKRIVVFGHTHRSDIIPSYNYKGEKSIYANTGTWIDHSPIAKGPTTTFIVIEPQSNEPSSQTYVKLYNFLGEKFTEMAKNSLRL
ncbi:hypothetical protein APF79_14505 [bacterium BRH_c32]|nr:MAG: hypothetical protein APF79_14505 [bacterium BRH_c32]